MSRQVQIDLEIIRQHRHQCHRCEASGFHGYLVFGNGSAVCVNCRYDTELSARGERLSKIPSWLYAQKLQVREL